MRGRNLRAEDKVNIIIDHEKRGLGAQKIGKKYNLDNSTVSRFLKRYGEELAESKTDIFPSGEFQKVEMPDEALQSDSEKIAFYKGEIEKYKSAAIALEKKLGLSIKEKNVFQAREIENVAKNHEISEIDGKWKMSREEFMDFFEDFTNAPC